MVLWFVSVSATANAASIIYDGGSPNQSGAFYADSRTDYTQVTAIVDTAGRAFTVNGINWWGIYANFGANDATATAPTDAFRLNIYQWNPLEPGAQVDSISLGGGNRTATGKEVSPGSLPAASEFAYSASFAAVSLAPGLYYFALSDTTISGENWALEFNQVDSGFGGDSYDQSTASWIPTDDGEFPIQLTGTATTPVVPLPASVWLLISGLGVLGAWGSRASIPRRKLTFIPA